MSLDFAVPETNDPDSTDDDALLLPWLAQLLQARADQQEALTWLAEHAPAAP